MRRISYILLATVALAGTAVPAGAADSARLSPDPGRKLYVNKCAKCHKFYDPAKYSDATWEDWMTKMSKKSKLTPAQEKELSKYIRETFRSGKNQRADAAKP